MDDWSLNNFLSRKINTPHQQLTMLCEYYQMFFTGTVKHILCLVLKLGQWETHRSRRKIHFLLIAFLGFFAEGKGYLDEISLGSRLPPREVTKYCFCEKERMHGNCSFDLIWGWSETTFYLHRFNRDKIQGSALSILSCNGLRPHQSICIQVTNIPYLCVVLNEEAFRGLKLVEPWHSYSS